MKEPECYARVQSGISYQTLTKVEQKEYFAWITRPKFLRVVGRHRINDYSFGLMSARGDIEQGTFGYIPRFTCEHCGTISEPESVCTYKETWGFYGGTPAEYEYVCPDCGSYDCGPCEDYDYEGAGMKLIRRFVVSLGVKV